MRAVRGRGGQLRYVGLALVTILLAGCAAGADAEITSRPLVADQILLDDPTVGVTSPATTTVAPSRAAPTTVMAAEADPPPGLGIGAEGPIVLALEQKLEKLKYYVGQVDSAYDADTRDAVLAFQKVAGMDRTGRATDDVVAAVTEATVSATPLVPAGGYKRVEIDLERQVLFLYEGNNLSTILGVSTGSDERFCSEGWCRRAVTPPGSFVVYEKHSGWEKSPLGWLYNSQYFNGGIAIHGSSSVPGYPASHGCVRISMSAAEWFPDKLSVGTPVYVVSADEPHPTPVGLNRSPTSTPTTIVPDTSAQPSTTTTTLNLLQQLLTPPTTPRP